MNMLKKCARGAVAVAIASMTLAAMAQERDLPLAEARAQIGQIASDPVLMTSIMKQLPAADQATFLGDVNAAIESMPGSSEEKAATFLNVNRAALKGAAKGNLSTLLAEVFATVPPDALTVVSERFASDLLSRSNDPSKKYTNDEYIHIATNVLRRIEDRTAGSDDAGVRDVLAVSMLTRASEGEPANLLQALVDALPDQATRDMALNEWLPAALGESFVDAAMSAPSYKKDGGQVGANAGADGSGAGAGSGADGSGTGSGADSSAAGGSAAGGAGAVAGADGSGSNGGSDGAAAGGAGAGAAAGSTGGGSGAAGANGGADGAGAVAGAGAADGSSSGSNGGNGGQTASSGSNGGSGAGSDGGGNIGDKMSPTGNYDSMIAYTGSDSQPSPAVTIQLAGPQAVDALLADIAADNRDPNGGLDTPFTDQTAGGVSSAKLNTPGGAGDPGIAGSRPQPRTEDPTKPWNPSTKRGDDLEEDDGSEPSPGPGPGPEPPPYRNQTFDF